ncbi:MAG TPA: multidrug ABC transporter ATP-binding protein [Lachnospiraceae bacterium]|nr:multidrug ABC transporter ATP-binding protein [Lachnospiraceae bacterium]
MLRLAKYLKKYKLYVFLAPLLMGVEVISELLQPKLMAKIVNIGVANNDINYIIKIGGFMLLVSILGIVGGIGCLIFSSLASQNFGADVREDLFIKIQQFSFFNIDKFKTSSLITRLTNDITQMQTIVLMSLRILVRAPLLSIGGIIMAFSVNKKLTIVFLAIIPISAITIAVLIKHSFPLFKVVQNKLDKVNTVMRENLSGVRVVKVFVRGKHEIAKFDEANEDYKDTTIKAFRTIVLLMPVMMLLMNCAAIAVIYFGGLQVVAGDMLVGDVMAFITYLSQILMSLMMVSMFFMVFSRAKVSGDRIIEVLETEIEIVNPQNPVETPITNGKIEFRNVSFKYEGGSGEPVLENVNFVAEAGQTVAILGETGSGKSSLVNLIPRLYDVLDGEILIDGTNVKNMDLTVLRSDVSVVLQESILFSGTIKDNLLWGKENATDEEIISASKNAQAHDFIINFPDKYQTNLGQKGVNLSGGQKQRISIARALIKKPKILIFDDSTSAVDMVTEKKIQKALSSDLKNSTKIIIAQRISSVLNADKILVLGNGTIVAEGTHNELLKNSKDYQEIYYSQAGKEAAIND